MIQNSSLEQSLRVVSELYKTVAVMYNLKVGCCHYARWQILVWHWPAYSPGVMCTRHISCNGCARRKSPSSSCRCGRASVGWPFFRSPWHAVLCRKLSKSPRRSLGHNHLLTAWLALYAGEWWWQQRSIHSVWRQTGLWSRVLKEVLAVLGKCRIWQCTFQVIARTQMWLILVESHLVALTSITHLTTNKRGNLNTKWVSLS